MKFRKIFIALAMVGIFMSMHAQPAGINHDANRILLNGADWSDLMDELASDRVNNKITIVHIGDSHVQPGTISGEVRKALQEKYGNGGRGLVCPLTLAKTNGPQDCSMKSSAAISAASKLIARSHPAGMGMTGVAVKFAGASTTLQVSTKDADGEFLSVNIFHSPNEPFEVWQDGEMLNSHRISPYADMVVLDSACTAASLALKGHGALYGMRLLSGKTGVVVDCIGNNGATYASYVKIPDFAVQLRDLNPRLVIISLGTNEAYGNYSSITSNIDRLLHEIERECPGVQFLLTTPLETHKKSGGGYITQSGVKGVRDLIMDYGRRNHVAVWDFYTVGGGEGAAKRWLSTRHMNTDHLHLTSAGYHVQGSLLSQALLNLLTGVDDGSDIEEPGDDGDEPQESDDADSEEEEVAADEE